MAKMNLLRQIQDHLAASSPDISAALRKCKILARRLHSSAFEQWVDCELNGYPEGAEVPSYRTVHPSHFASFSNGYQTVERHQISIMLIEEKWQKYFEPFPYRDGVEAIKTLAASEHGGHLDRSELRFLLTNKVIRLPCYRFWSEISKVELRQILSAIANRMLDFVMDIEAENPDAGEAAAKDVPVPPERVQQLVQNYFHGPVGNVAQNSSQFSQTANLDLEEIRQLARDLRTHFKSAPLDTTARADAEAQLKTIEAQLKSSQPSTSILREAGRSLRTVLEGALGNAVATPEAWPAMLKALHHLF